MPAVDGPLTDDFAVPAARPPVGAYERLALATRQDLRAAVAGIEAARQGVEAAVGQYFPSVSLNVAGFLYREFYADASKWNAVLTANLPIFSAGVIEADVRNAWSRLRQAALNESGLRRRIVHDVRVAYENLATSDRRIHELEDEVRAAEEAHQQARNAFLNNLAINLDVLSAQDQLLNSQLQLTSAKFDRTVFYLDLLRATGTLHEVAAGPAASTAPATAPGPLRSPAPPGGRGNP